MLAPADERMSKAAEDCRTYSSSKVIHRWRGGLLVHPPQPAV